MKILLVGGLGYIGSHTAVSLIENGYEVIIFDNLSNSHKSTIDSIEKINGVKVPLIIGDIRDNSLSDVFKENSIDTVIHFAAFKSVPNSLRDPLGYYENNVGGTINLLKIMDENNVKKIIFSSSCTVYGNPDKYPVTEKTPLKKSETPYGESKLICEQIIESSCNNLGFESVSLRYFNPIGSHETGIIFENPKGPTENLMPHIKKAIEKGIPLKVFGNDYNTPDGTAIRDYIDINDLALAHVKSISILKEGIQYINVGSGNGYSVMEIINEFKSLGINVPYEIHPRRDGDIEKIFSDISLAEDIMNWTPLRTLKDSVKSLIKRG